MRFTFTSTHDLAPYLLFEIARPSVTTSNPTNITYPLGSASIPDTPFEICGWSSERQDSIIAPVSIAPFAAHFKGYFCARFDLEPDSPQPTFGIVQNTTVLYPFENGTVEGALLSAHAIFPKSAVSNTTVVTVRVGTSFISEDQARRNLVTEIPDRTPVPTSSSTSAPAPTGSTPLHLQPGTFENTAHVVRKSWTDILEHIEVLPYANEEETKGDKRAAIDLASFWTGVVHTLQACSHVPLSFSMLTENAVSERTR